MRVFKEVLKGSVSVPPLYGRGSNAPLQGVLCEQERVCISKALSREKKVGSKSYVMGQSPTVGELCR